MPGGMQTLTPGATAFAGGFTLLNITNSICFQDCHKYGFETQKTCKGWEMRRTGFILLSMEAKTLVLAQLWITPSLPHVSRQTPVSETFPPKENF